MTYMQDGTLLDHGLLQLVPAIDGNLDLSLKLFLSVQSAPPPLLRRHLLDGRVEARIDSVAVILVLGSLLLEAFATRRQ